MKDMNRTATYKEKFVFYLARLIDSAVIKDVAEYWLIYISVTFFTKNLTNKNDRKL